MQQRHPYASFLGQVVKPSRYLGGEYQEARKDLSGVDARVCLAFPDVYEIGMSHLGTKILYGILNKDPRIACERAFSPWVDCEAQIRAHGLPLVTLETATPLGQFDVIGMSLQYELTYTNVLNVLDLAGLPLRAAQRGDQAPLILCGGPTATHPEPLAPFIDAFFIGEAEEALPALVLEAARLRRAGVARRERLIQLAARFPLYVPELYAVRRDPDSGFVVVAEPVDPRVPARPKRAWVADINKFPFPDDSPLPYGEAIFDRMAVEVARGCTEGCRFCQAGMIYRPVRERDPVQVVETLLAGVRKGGYDETSLTSLSTADYSCVTPLVKAAMAKLRDEKVSLSVSSLRAYGLNDDLLAEMATMRAGGLTFAPEAGTQRMRDVITKNVTEDDIIESAHRVFSRGFHRMKLYFMIGLPTETDEDVRGIVETAARVQAIGRRYQSGATVTASVSTHVPKPHTPFQWCAMDSEAETARKQKILAETAQRLRVDLKMHENLQSHLEAIFSRGDRDTADVLERAFRLGCRFDSWDEQLRMDLWDQAIEESLAGTADAPHPDPLPASGARANGGLGAGAVVYSTVPALSSAVPALSSANPALSSSNPALSSADPALSSADLAAGEGPVAAVSSAGLAAGEGPVAAVSSAGLAAGEGPVPSPREAGRGLGRGADGLHLERYLGTIPVTSKLPWDHIDIALEPDFLLKEYRKAMKDRLSPPCGKPYKKLLHPSSVEAAEVGWKDKLICYDCGVACDLGGMKEERLYYLRRMNAWTPPVEAAPAARPDAGPDGGDGPRPARKKHPAPPTRIQQSDPHRVRLRYTKLGRVAYLGHLDLVRHLPRIFRRAGVELNYSLGFHPKPDLSFGPALGLGIPSLGELLDVKLSDRVDAPELVRRLQAVTLDGIRWTGGVNLGTNDRALGRVVSRAEFWAALPPGAAAQAGLERWRAADPIKVKRQGEGAGVGRMIDVRRALLSLEAPPLSAAERVLVRDELGWMPAATEDATQDASREAIQEPIPDPTIIRFQLAVSTEGSAKPIEVLEGLWGSEIARAAAIARAHLWGDALPDGTLIDALDTEALRTVTLAAAAGLPLEAPAGMPPAPLGI